MMDSPNPIHEWQRFSLSIADRNQGLPAITCINGTQFRDVEPSVHRRDRRNATQLCEGETPTFEVRVNDIESTRGVIVNVAEHWELENSAQLRSPFQSEG